MTTLAIVEDDASIRESLELYVKAKSQIEVLDPSDSVESFLTKTFDSEPKLLLLDIGLPGMTGIEGLPLIKEKYPDLDVIMLTTYEEDDVIFSALCAGACSYISKRTSLAKIVEALHIVANGGSYMSPSIAKKVANFFFAQPKKPKIKLSDRQKEIVECMVKGDTYTQIAEKLYISLNTVRSHIKKIYSILEINNKAVLIKKFMDGEI